MFENRFKTVKNLSKCIGLLIGSFLLSSCFSIDAHLEKKSQELSKQLANEPMWESLPVREISWQSALKLMLSNNLSMKQAQLSLKQAERSVSALFMNFIPGINLDAILSKELSELSNIRTGDLSYNANILFSSPSITQFPFDYYTAKASVLRANKAIDLKKRELISNLYLLVENYRVNKLNYEVAIKQIYNDPDGLQKKEIEENWESTRRGIATQFSELFNDVNAQWYVNPETMPRINWEKYRKASKHLDKLMVTMVAMEVEASRLNVLNAKAGFFPKLDVTFYSPSLFSSSGGTISGAYLSGGDLKVDMRLTQEMDTRLNKWYSYKFAKESHKLVLEQVRVDLLKRRQKVVDLVLSREKYHSWKSYKDKRYNFIMSQTPLSAEEYVSQKKELMDIQKEIEQKQAENVQVESALIMEYGVL